MKSGLLLSILLCCGCQHAAPVPQAAVQALRPAAVVSPSGRTVQERFNPPPGYRRSAVPAGSYAAFLRRVPLRPDGAPVHYYDGRIKANPGIYAAVLSYDAGSRDLQQCADAVMRLRAEYFRSIGRLDRISFTLTNGFRAAYSRWMQGERPRFTGRTAVWQRIAEPSDSYASFRRYLDMIFSYAGTLSLSRELQPVAYSDMRPGDVLIIGGTPGHAVTVMDMAENGRGEKVYLLSQSYMPAQEIQILHNPSGAAISPWYRLDTSVTRIATPQWIFYTGQLMRFPGD